MGGALFLAGLGTCCLQGPIETELFSKEVMTLTLREQSLVSVLALSLSMSVLNPQ